MARCVRVLIALVFLAALGQARLAQAEMAFSHWSDSDGVKWGQGVRDYVFADGDITKYTPAKLQAALARFHAHPGTILVLNSPGGILPAGLEMGRIIRAAKLWTTVGSERPLNLGLPPNIDPDEFPYTPQVGKPPFPGYCHSACTFAFLGGVFRTVGIGSLYGVHQFEWTASPQTPGAKFEDQAEREMGELVSYLEEMDVDPALLRYMVAKRGDVSLLTQQQMAQLRVITPLWQTGWRLEQSPENGFYLRARTTTPGDGLDLANVYCGSPTERSAGDLVVMEVYFQTPEGVKPADFVPGVTAYNIRLDEDGLSVPKGNPHVLSPAFVSPHGRIGVKFGFPLRAFEVLLSSHDLGLTLYNPNGPVTFLGTRMTLNGKTLERFAKLCVPPKKTDFVLVNSGSEPLVALRWRVSGTKSFGPNQLSQPLAPGQHTPAPLAMPHDRGCAFDLAAFYAHTGLVRYIDFDLCLFKPVSFTNPSPLGFSLGGMRSFKIDNVGEATIIGVYISSHTDKSWGRNLLAANAIPAETMAPGASRLFPFPATLGRICQVDIRVAYSGTQPEDRYNWNACTWSEAKFAATPAEPEE